MTAGAGDACSALRTSQSDQPHATHALDRDQQIDGAEYRPPALHRAIDPAAARQPLVGSQRRTIATELPRLDFEAEQAQPVAQPAVGDEFAGGRQEQALAACEADPAQQPAAALAQPPHAGRIEADDDHLAFGHQHPLDLAQRQMRIAREFERMRQQHQIETAAVERQARRIRSAERWRRPASPARRQARRAGSVASLRSAVARARGPDRSHTSGAASDWRPAHRVCGSPSCTRMEAEHVGDKRSDLPPLPFEQISARGGFQPLSQTYNRATFRHETDRTPCLHHQRHPDSPRRAAKLSWRIRRTRPLRSNAQTGDSSEPRPGRAVAAAGRYDGMPVVVDSDRQPPRSQIEPPRCRPR